MDQNSYMTDKEAAEYLNISVHTLRSYRKIKDETNGPKFHKLGRSVRYTKEDLDNWAKNGEY